MTPGFGERLAEHVARRRSQLVLGLDPDPTRLWPAAPGPGEDAPPHDAQPLVRDDATAPTAASRAASAVVSHCGRVMAAVAPQCVAVKLQVACFERLGAAGWSALASAIAIARDHGLLVIADAKRGDIDVTARAYAEAFFGGAQTPFGPVPGLGVDALTVNALLGEDSVMPLLQGARAGGAGLFVLVRTSNPGAALIQDRVLDDGGTVSDALADLVRELGEAGTGPAGIADVGAVVGATVPGHLARLREAMPAAPLLLPGVGAQGGAVSALTPAFAPGRAGGLVAVSRGLVYAFEKAGGDPADAAREEASRLRALAWSLTGDA
jgi:orotidine-5'-phosphate decarboxylase